MKTLAPFACLLVFAAAALAQPPAGAAEPAEAAVAAAVRLAGSGDLDGAIGHLEPLRRTQTATPPVLSLLGALYLEAGRPADALSVLEPLASGPDADPAVLYNAARAAAAGDDPARAGEWLRRAADLAPESPAARQLGMVLAQQGRVVEAYARLRPWVLAQPTDGDARVAAAALALQLERPEEAEQLLAGLDDSSPAIRLLEGRALVQAGRGTEALAVLRPLLSSHPEGMELEVRRALAEAYLLVGQAQEALRVLEGRTASHPSLALLAARAERQAGRPGRARELLAPLAAQLPAEGAPRPADPRLPARVAAEYGHLLLVEGKTAEAVAMLRRSVALHPSDREAWQGLARALSASGQSEAAQEATTRAAALAAAAERRAAAPLPPLGRGRSGVAPVSAAAAAPQPGAAEAPLPEGMREAVEAMGSRPAEALTHARRAKLAAPTDLRPRMLEVRLLLTLRRYAEALDGAEAALALGPDRPELVYQRGAVLLALDRRDEAERDLRRALELAPSYLPALNDLGVLMVLRGRSSEAEALFERVLSINPGDPRATASLAQLRGRPLPTPPR